MTVVSLEKDSKRQNKRALNIAFNATLSSRAKAIEELIASNEAKPQKDNNVPRSMREAITSEEGYDCSIQPVVAFFRGDCLSH